MLTERIKDEILKALVKQGYNDYSRKNIILEVPKFKKFGDYASNIAMHITGKGGKEARELAEKIIVSLKDSVLFSKIDLAGPGFINIFVEKKEWFKGLCSIHEAELEFGNSKVGYGEKILLEYVSANPTGPLHVGHGRGAVIGDVLARILKKTGFNVTEEYLINDAGLQIQKLGKSVLVRYKQLIGENAELEDDHYPGEYIIEVAEKIKKEKGNSLTIDITNENELVSMLSDYASVEILSWIKTDLKQLGVEMDVWFSEKEMQDKGEMESCLEYLKEKKKTYKKDGAIWFNSSDFGDEKDRVLIRENGISTYFASDVSYHKNKIDRGFDRLINIWGADHHGYIARVRASIEAMGHDPSCFEVIMIQLVSLIRKGEQVKMGKRAGTFVTLSETLNEVGKDAMRYFFCTRKSDAQMDFDLDLAKSQTMDNPVYYAQYGHARICSIIRKAKEINYEVKKMSEDELQVLTLEEEIDLIKKLHLFPEILIGSALAREPHRITFYLQELISEFHSYYTRYKDTERVLSDDSNKTYARLYLVDSIRQVVAIILGLIGVSIPEKMYFENKGKN